MAKVTGPLHSDDARGKFAGAMVFSNWKGKKYCRSLVIPSNPQSEAQGDQRLIMGGTSKGIAKIGVGGVIDLALIALGVIPSDQSKQSFLVKRILQVYMFDATSFEVEVAEFDGHSATSDFESSAITLGLAAFDITYKGTTNDYDAGLQLYMCAKACFLMGLTAEPFDTALDSWTSTEIDEFVADLASA